MERFRSVLVFALTCLLVFGAGSLSFADPRKHDIGSAGQPTITGSLGGSVTGNASLLSDLVVTVNFGELLPINPNNIIKVVVPVAIRSTNEYAVSVSVTGTVGGNPNSVQLSDIGFGIQNFRSLGARATACSANSIINSQFYNDPAASVTINPATGRAQYPSSLASVGASTVIINGPVLSIFNGVGNWRRDPDNGRAFDAILTIKPQWFEPGTFSLTITFRMSDGPNFPC
jgi:spore coat protein U-like protein